MFKLRGQGKGLAVVAILMGMAAWARAGDERMLYASLGDTARAPIGWIEFCADNASECRGGTSEPRDIVLSQTAEHQPEFWAESCVPGSHRRTPRTREVSEAPTR